MFTASLLNRHAPPVTNRAIASALLALSAAEKPGSRPASEYRSAAWTLRQLPDELFGRRIRLASLPGVSVRAADLIDAFLACHSDEGIEDRLVALLDRQDPRSDLKKDFLSRADVDRVLAVTGDAGVSMKDLRADLHLHTDRSDGKTPLKSLFRALSERGDTYAFLTDHARDCAVAGGLFPADFRAQRRELDVLNDRADGLFKMFLGAEANIAEDGTIDITPAKVPELDGVVASIHTDLRTQRDQTARLVRAIETPGVAVLGHPKGRLYDLRHGIRADWPKVFEAATERGVAIELNGCPERLDAPPALAALARDAGCLFSISSDAHAQRHLDFVKYSLAVARIARIPAERVVNTWSRERFADWLEERRSPHV
jgi:histidinol phosphatase-like PHP family hydrolase